MSLKEYNKKRNFKITKEPIGELKKSNKKLKFIIQHHIATKDHYDFRLEYDGVLKSFAVPKGPSYNPNDKRLAIPTEDHPLSYATFEGIIPEGEYGAGTVMLWDKGYWEPIDTPKFNKEVIKFKVFGERIKGLWTLVPFKDDYLLIKEKDKYHEYDDINKINTSIKTGKTINEINGEISITHSEKVIVSNPKITKGDIFTYYDKVSTRMIPYIQNRLISVIRCPNGNKGDCFYMKHLETKNKRLGSKTINKEKYYYIKNKNGLLSEVQMNSYEFHIWGSLYNNINKPDILVFDLDPDEKLSLNKLREGVKDLKQILDNLKLKSFIKTSGGKGYHIVVPMNTKSWDENTKIAKDIALLMESKYPEKYTTNERKKLRKNKIFIDYLRNLKGATSVAPYSVRIRKKCTVSMPIKWSELNKIKPNEITMDIALKRIKHANPWKDFF